MSHLPRVTNAQAPWALGEGERGENLALNDDFFELCAEVARQHQLLPSVFYSLVLETKLCPPTTVGAPNVFSTLQAGAAALARLLKNAGGSYHEASNLFLAWAAEYTVRLRGQTILQPVGEAKHANLDDLTTIAAQQPQSKRPVEPAFRPKLPARMEGARRFLEYTMGMAQAANDITSYAHLDRNTLLGVVWYRRTLNERTPPLPQGTHNKESMLVPMNVPAMLRRLEQLFSLYPGAYDGINLRFVDAFRIPIVDLDPTNELQNLTGAAIDIALIMHLHNCTIASALCGFSRLDKAAASAFSNNVLQAAHEIGQGYQSLSRHLWG